MKEIQGLFNTNKMIFKCDLNHNIVIVCDFNSIQILNIPNSSDIEK